MASTIGSFLERQYNVVAYTMIESLCKSAEFCKKPLIPFEDLEARVDAATVSAIVAVGYVEMNKVRERVSQELINKGFELASYLNEQFIVHQGVNIGTNSVVLDNTSVHANSNIGNNVFLASGVNIGHDCVIEDNVWINSGVSIGGGCTIGANTFLGINATVSHDINLGRKTFVGANTFVKDSTNDGSVVLSPPGEILPVDSEKFLIMSQGMNRDK